MAYDHAGQPSGNPWFTLDVDNLIAAEAPNLLDQALVVSRSAGY
jgi:hypothetical protein